MTVQICTGIRKVKNGYIVALRWPFGGEPMGGGEVICKTWQEVLDKLTEAQKGLD